MDKSDKISIHAPHEGERPQGSPFVWSEYDFNPRSPRGGATSTLVNPGMEIDISIHAPHEGERLNVSRDKAKNWRAFQSTLPARGSDDASDLPYYSYHCISIHAPREGERRAVHIRHGGRHNHFNPRSPRGGATFGAGGALHCRPYFNPRSPRGGATRSHCYDRAVWHISIHAPREGERRSGRAALSIAAHISIHAPREGERRGHTATIELFGTFQSTLPARGSDDCKHSYRIDGAKISIHAPREGERPAT